MELSSCVIRPQCQNSYQFVISEEWDAVLTALEISNKNKSTLLLSDNFLCIKLSVCERWTVAEWLGRKFHRVCDRNEFDRMSEQMSINYRLKNFASYRGATDWSIN